MSSPVLGLDYGDRRVGVAISDPARRVASSRETIVYTAMVELFEALELILFEESIEEVVVGLPLGLSGEDTPQTERVRAFSEQLADLYDVKVHLEDERFTSVQAQRHGAAHSVDEDIDAHAAQALLQGFLDRFQSVS